jgi:hypothetical protein
MRLLFIIAKKEDSMNITVTMCTLSDIFLHESIIKVISSSHVITTVYNNTIESISLGI